MYVCGDAAEATRKSRTSAARKGRIIIGSLIEPGGSAPGRDSQARAAHPGGCPADKPGDIITRKSKLDP